MENRTSIFPAYTCGLILDDRNVVARWQYLALQHAVERGMRITLIARCTSRRSRALKLRSVGYYALAYFSRKGSTLFELIDVSPLLDPNCEIVEFESIWKGNWELIPEEVTSQFSELDVAVKLGMNLLLNPDSIRTRFGVLSFHHGDPTKYRGRPAVFHEMANGEKTVGAMVQRLNTTLDGGAILAQCRAPITDYSYRETLNNTYFASIPLLHKAICASRLDQKISPPESLGTLRTLPRNGKVFGLVAKVLGCGITHILYGLFVEKIWQLGQLPQPIDEKNSNKIDVADLKVTRAPQGFSFIADPFVFGMNIYCEGMNAMTGTGHILRYDGDWHELDLDLKGKHVSYPQIISLGSEIYLFPEVGTHSSPQLYELSKDGKIVKSITPLLGLENNRLADATLFSHGGNWYLFGSQGRSTDYQLDLWVAGEISGPYQSHPSSPIRIDPDGSRMAGPLHSVNGVFLRLGQDCTSRYGDGVRIFQVTNLTSTEYEEFPMGSVKMSGAFGPHTLSWQGDDSILDFYHEQISLMAGIRRARAYLQFRKGH